MDMFKFSEKKKIEAMQDMSKAMSSNGTVDFAHEMMIQTAVMGDQLAQEYGIEEEEFNKAVAEHNLFQDLEVKQMLQDNMKNLPPEVMQMMMMQMMNQEGGAGMQM